MKLEVLDWGGSGRNLVLLAGGGNTAHVFASMAPKLATHFHVFGITRRGAGKSSAPSSGYTAKQFGDDVVAILDALHLTSPALVGHSIAGEEMSAVAKYHPGRVSALIYLDAGGPFALYNPDHGDIDTDRVELQEDPVSRELRSGSWLFSDWDYFRVGHDSLMTNAPMCKEAATGAIFERR